MATNEEDAKILFTNGIINKRQLKNLMYLTVCDCSPAHRRRFRYRLHSTSKTVFPGDVISVKSFSGRAGLAARFTVSEIHVRRTGS